MASSGGKCRRRQRCGGRDAGPVGALAEGDVGAEGAFISGWEVLDAADVFIAFLGVGKQIREGVLRRGRGRVAEG